MIIYFAYHKMLCDYFQVVFLGIALTIGCLCCWNILIKTAEDSLIFDTQKTIPTEGMRMDVKYISGDKNITASEIKLYDQETEQELPEKVPDRSEWFHSISISINLFQIN